MKAQYYLKPGKNHTKTEPKIFFQDEEHRIWVKWTVAYSDGLRWSAEKQGKIQSALLYLITCINSIFLRKFGQCEEREHQEGPAGQDDLPISKRPRGSRFGLARTKGDLPEARIRSMETKQSKEECQVQILQRRDACNSIRGRRHRRGDRRRYHRLKLEPFSPATAN